MAENQIQDAGGRRERIKEELQLVRMIIGILLAAELSVVGWFGQHVKTLDGVIFTFWLIGFALLSVGILHLRNRAIWLLDCLEAS
jgi:hypothetical protein